MSPKAKSAAATMEAPSKKEQPVTAVSVSHSGTVPIDNIAVKSNFRKHFDEKKMAELSDSIRKVGILEPVLVRQENPNSTAASSQQRYLLIAGERRLRAAEKAGLAMVPVRCLIVDDQQAAEIQAFENLHRQDLSPIEEAQAFKTLLEQGGYDVKALSERVDKSESYVHRSIKLLELPEKVQDAIEAGSVSATHGRMLLRATPKAREKLAGELLAHLKRHGETPTASSFWEDVERAVGRDLSKAPFPKDVPYAGQQACAGCFFNSGNQKDLFDGVAKGSCTNPGCFDAKMTQNLLDFQTEQADKFSKTGMDYAGTAKSEYNLTGRDGLVKGGRVLSQEERRNPKIKALMNENPSKFCWAVVEGDNWYPRKSVVIAISAATIRAVSPNSSSSYTTPRQSIKDKFVEAALEKALIQAAADIYKKSGPKAPWLELVSYELRWSDENTEMAFSSLGLEKPKGAKGLETLTGDELKGIVWMLSISDTMRGTIGPERLRKLGVDVAKVKKEAKAMAVKEWDLKKGKGLGKETTDAEDQD